MSPATEQSKSIPRKTLTDFAVFQNKIRDNTAKICTAGENILKKSLGFTVLKYALAATTEFGISLLTASEMTIELKTLVNKTPLAKATDVNKISFFIFLVFSFLNFNKNFIIKTKFQKISN